jgi:hypothetical protein
MTHPNALAIVGMWGAVAAIAFASPALAVFAGFGAFALSARIITRKS